MKLSLVTATYGRVEEVRQLLESLRIQTYKHFELIIVDQNEHDKLEQMVKKYNELNVKYIRSNVKGLSYNRNIGLKYVTGKIVGFPDDDCYYDENLLETVAGIFNDYSYYKLVAVEGKDTVSDEIFLKKLNRDIKRKDLCTHLISFNFFIKRNPEMKFDENLGVGTKYGSGEETDFLLEYFNCTDVGCFAENTFVHHPSNIDNSNDQRAYKYGLGFGAMCKKEIIKRKHFTFIFYYLRTLFRSLGGMIITKNKKFYYNSFKGRLKGFIYS